MAGPGAGAGDGDRGARVTPGGGRVAVTGAKGRLGRALMAVFADPVGASSRGPAFIPFAWSRPELDLDRPQAVHALLQRDRPGLVVHAAAWTDVDGCARDPDLARRRNGYAVHVIAEAAAARGVSLVLVSTNEVFDGRRTDGRGYRPDDPTAPPNAYGASKLAGEIAASAAYRGRKGARLAIVRTAWLYGPPGNDFPGKIIAAALRARANHEALRVVGDEVGSPTLSTDLAEAIRDIATADGTGFLHVVNPGAVSRAGWAREVLRLTGIDVAVEEVPASTWVRASTPPRWAVLEPSPLPARRPMRPWQEALAAVAPWLRAVAEELAAGVAAGGSSAAQAGGSR